MTDRMEPLGEMNTTPLIDVMLVLLIMFIISIPVATHAVDVDLPACDNCTLPPLDPDRNKIVIDARDTLLWNGTPIRTDGLALALARTRMMAVEPELQFEPDARASYEAAAQTLAVIEASGVSKFGFVGNERYRTFP